MKVSEMRKYAKLIVRVGANVQKGQKVVIASNVEDAYFTKYVVEEAYKAKASMVEVDWGCDEITKLVYHYSKTDALKELPEYKIKRLEYRRDKLPAMIYIDSSDPDALKDVDQGKIMKVRAAQGPIIRPIRKQMENKYQWTIAAIPGEAWAKKVFPNLSKKQAVKALWEAIFKCARVEGDAVANWKAHNANLQEKCDKLNAMNIVKLIYKSKSSKTDFSVGLKKGLQFMGGGSYTYGGVYYNPNMPTEECFITPDKNTAEGKVFATKPLSLNGKVLENFGFEFKNGEVVRVIADDYHVADQLEDLMMLDDGAKRLGEVALVPFDSPVNKSKLLFYNTLFDENACCHLALGMGFEDTIKGYENMTREEIDAFDINDSIIHVDFMIGTKDLSIQAELEDGSKVAIFEKGTWAI